MKTKYSTRLRAGLPARRLLYVLVVAALDALAAQPAVNTLPIGGQIVAGQGRISQTGAAMTVVQDTSRMVANWQSFNIGQAASVQFLQPSVSAMVLNRVLSADPSQIYGRLSANGQVFIVNPAGVVFGPSAQVDASGLVAAAMSLSNADFLAGRFNFTGAGTQVANLGQIAAREGGVVALVGAQVDNSGSITAPSGQVALVAGQGARLELGASGLISVAVNADTAAKVQNNGFISADGGRVWLTANRTGDALGAAINQEGQVRASTLASRNGEIWLDGGAGETRVSGSVLAQGVNGGETGGKIVATGGNITLASTSKLDASGSAGGGQVLVGGGWQGKDPAIREANSVVQEAGSRISVNATTEGDGGTAVAWSGASTQLAGEITARGAGSGSGGAIETSSRGSLGVTGRVDAGAASGNGGLWLLDPTNVTAASGSGGAVPYPVDTTPVFADTISAALGTNTSVSVQATGNITVGAAISKIADSGGTAPKLTLDAVGDITVNQAISASVGKLNLDFGTGANNSGTTTINSALSTNGGAVNFFKATTLAHASSISTKPGGVSTVDAGSVTFSKDTTLAAPGYAVTINTQGAESGGNYTSNGGAVNFTGSIISGKPAAVGWSPQALTIDTTAASGYTPGAITLGSTATNVVGATVADTSLSTNTTGPLRSLTIAGPTTIDLKAGAMNFANTSGNVLTASTSVTGSPRIVLDAADTAVTLTGGSVAGLTAGYTDLVQDTFNIGVASAIDRTLTFNSDRSIKIRNFGIDGVTGAGASKLDVALKPFAVAGATGGAVIMDNASILTNGGGINIGAASSTGFAVGVASDTGGIFDGVNLKNTVLTTAGGALTIAGKTASSSSVSSAGVKISGASTAITTTSGDINLSGVVQGQTSGNKDGVILGEGGASTVRLETTSGKLTVTGDASAVVAPTGGSRYDGVIVSSAALLKTASGDIAIAGTGGGGSQDFISENHGIRLENTNTSIVSATGNISLTGVSGGKTTATSVGDNSYGIYAKGVTMYIGKDSTGSSATGDISFIADSMQFENSGTSRLRVASAGELLIRPFSSNTNIEFGTAGTAPIAADGTRTLYLGSNWFNGSSIGIFQPGPVVTTSVVSGTEQQLSIQGNSGGTFTLTNGTVTTGNITYSSTPATLAGNIAAALGAAGIASTVTTNLDGTFKLVFTATQPELVANASAGFHDLTIGRADSTGRMTVAAATTLRDDVTLLAGTPSTAGRSAVAVNAGLTVKQQPNANTGRSLTIDVAGQGVTAISTGAITADKLLLLGNGDFVLNGSNLVNTLAAAVDGHLEFKNGQSLTIGSVSSDRFTTNVPLTTPTTTTTTRAGIFNTDGASATNKDVTLTLTDDSLTLLNNVNAGTGTVSLAAANGAVTESVAAGAVVTADKLYMESKNTSLLNNNNSINTLAASISEQSLEIKDNSSGLVLGQVAVTARTAASDGTYLAGTAVNKNGVTASSGTVAIQLSAGDLTQTQDVSASGLQLALGSGQANFDRTSNDIGTLAANLAGAGKALAVKDKNALTVGARTSSGDAGSIGTTTGVTTNLGNVTLAAANVAAGDLNLDQFINTGASSTGTSTIVDLTSASGAIKESTTVAAALVTADKLRLAATNTSLLNNQNVVNTVAANITGDGQGLDFANNKALTVGTVTSPDALTTTTGFTIGSAVSRGNALINTSGAGAAGATIGQTDPIVAAGLLLRSRGDVTLTNTANNVVTLVATTSATDATGYNLGYRDADGFAVGALADNAGGASVAGITAGGTADGKTVELESVAGALTQNATSPVTTQNLNLKSATGVTLDNTTNDVATLSGRVTGTGQFVYSDMSALTVGTVTDIAGAAIDGVQTSSGLIRISASKDAASTTGDLALTQDVIAGGTNTMTLESLQGAITETANVDLAATNLLLNAKNTTRLENTGAGGNHLIGTLAANLTGAAADFSFRNDQSLTIGSVTGQDTATSTAGITTPGGNIDLRAVGAASDLNLAAALTTTTGTLRLDSGRNINQTAGALTATGAYLNAGGDASLLQPGNRVMVFAANTGGRLDYLDAGSLAINTVTVVDGPKNGVTSGTRAWIRAQGDMTLQQPVVGNGAGSEAVVLVSDGAFVNLAGSGGVLTPASRWLIYDINPNLIYRLGGLPFNYRRIDSSYADYPPEKVAFLGNIYITNAVAVPPQQFSPPPITGAMPATSGPAVPGIGTPETPPVEFGFGTGPISASTADNVTLQGPLLVATRPGAYFEVGLGNFTGGEGIESAQLVTGEPLPAWLKLDSVNQRLTGVMPKEGSVIAVKLRLKSKDGKPGREIEVLLTPSSPA